MNSRDKHGKKVAFSIGYFPFSDRTRRSGPLKELTNVKMCGQRFDLNKAQMIAVEDANKADHPYPIHIPAIVLFNGKKVIW